MSGIIFNGQEMNNGETQKHYINRVVNEAVKKADREFKVIYDNKEFKIIYDKKDTRIYNDDSDTDSEINSDSDNEPDIYIDDDASDSESDDDNKLLERKQLFKNFKSQRDCNRHIETNDYTEYLHLVNMPEINNKQYYNNCKEVNKRLVYNAGDVVYCNDNELLKIFCLYEIIKVTRNHIKVRALEPILTIKHRNNNNDNSTRCNLYKYVIGNYTPHLKTRTFEKVKFNQLYRFKDYVYKSINLYN